MDELDRIPGTLTILTEPNVQNPDLDARTRSALADPSVDDSPVEMTVSDTRAPIEACFWWTDHGIH